MYRHSMRSLAIQTLALALVIAIVAGCGGTSAASLIENATAANADLSGDDRIDISNLIFDETSADCAVAEIEHGFIIQRFPGLATQTTAIEQQSYDGVMLNGVALDLLSAGCYRPDDPMADAEGNVPVGGSYDSRYVADYEFAGTGDLDECNGMSLNGQYGYYVTDSYPWVLACFSGTPDASFSKF